jgi:integrase/recombinase XerD
MRTLTPWRRHRRCALPPLDGHADDPLRAALAEYRNAALAEGCAQETVRTQAQAILRFFAWAAESGICTPQEISRNVLERYQLHLHQHRKRDGGPLSVGSQLVTLAALKAWLTWLVRKGHLPESPAEWLRVPRLPARLPATILSVAKVEAILALADTRTPLGTRDRAVLEMLYSAGIRRMELVNLALVDVDTAEGIAMVRRGKGQKDRLVPLGARACDWIEHYLRTSRPRLLRAEETTALFLNEFGDALNPRYLGDLVRRYLENAGITTRGACHVFRHAMATHMLDNGADIRHIQAILGHARLETTQIYTRVSIRKLKEVHAATHPASRLPAAIATPDCGGENLTED